MTLEQKDIFPTPKIHSNKGKIGFFLLALVGTGFIGVAIGPKIISAFEGASLDSKAQKKTDLLTPVQNPESWASKPNVIKENETFAKTTQAPLIVPSIQGTIGDEDLAKMGSQNANELEKQKEKALSSSISPSVNDQIQLEKLKEESEDSEDYLSSSKKAAKSPYELQAGTFIPATLQTGLNSDLPGYATAIVRENIYDTVTGKYLLVPKGTRLFGKYDSKVAYGQKRLLIAWNRLLFPDGASINIKGMGGTDRQGMSGFHDTVDNHFGTLLAGVIFSTVIGAGAQLSQPNTSSGASPSQSQTIGQTLAGQAGMQMSNVAGQVIQKNLSVEPTITIRPGYEFNVIVNKDIILEPIKD